MTDPVSSLYGPGAMICWVCTSLAVYLSWSFNHASQRHDRFTSDVLGCLILPAIASIHWFIEMARFGRNHEQAANQTTNAAFTVCMYFMPVGIALSLLAFLQQHKRRLAVTLVTTIPCVLIFTITVLCYGTKAPKVETSGGGLACFLVFLVMIPALRFTPKAAYGSRLPPTKSSNAHVRKIQRMAIWVLRVSLFFLQWSGFITLFLLQARNGVLDGLGDEVTPNLTVLPQTPYSVRDIDQAVALSIGIITLLLALLDVLKNYRFPITDEFQYWKNRCLEDIEYGNAKIDVEQWRKDVTYIEKKANCVITRTKHHKREKRALRKLPIVVKKCLERRTPDARMKALGFI